MAQLVTQQNHIAQFFDAKTFHRGENYFRTDKVISFHVDADAEVIEALVSGNYAVDYNVHIAFKSVDEHIRPLGYCSCPVGRSCKHVVAALLQAQAILPKELQHLFGQQTASVAAPARLELPPLAQASGNSAQIAIVYRLQKNSRGIYALFPQYINAQGILEEYSVKPEELAANPWQVVDIEHDQAIFQYASDYRILYADPQYGVFFDLADGSSYQLIRGLLVSNRITINSPQGELLPVKPHFDITADVAWSIQPHQGVKPIFLDQQTNRQVELLVNAVDKPALFIDMPDNEDSYHASMGMMLNIVMPHKLHKAIAAYSSAESYPLEALQTAIGDYLPPFEESLVPAKFLKTSMEIIPLATGAGIRLFYQYEFNQQIITVPHLSYHMYLYQFMPDNQGVVYTRRLHYAEGDIARLLLRSFMVIQADDQAHGRADRQAPGEPRDRVVWPVERKAFWLGPDTGKNYTSDWLAFFVDVLPIIKARGVDVVIDPSLDYDFFDVEEESWYLKLDEDNTGGNQWFELSLGFDINGEQVDLLPELAKQLDQLPNAQELAKNPQKKYPVELPEQQYALITGKRLAPIVAALLELSPGKLQQDGFKKGERLKVTSFHSKLLAALHDDMTNRGDFHWRGNNKLLNLGQQLKTIKKLPKLAKPKSVNATLRSYQRYGFQWMHFLQSHALNGILADDMGLGKTLQALTLLAHHYDNLPINQAHKPTLIICPTSLINNWQKEAQKFTPKLNVGQYYGPDRTLEVFEQADVIVTSYGVTRIDWQSLQDIRFHTLVLDEAQAIKNDRSRLAMACKMLQAEHKLCLTGTPIENHLGELWALFDFLMPGFLQDKKQFKRLYRTPIEKKANRQCGKRLQQKIAPFILRRTKEKVAKDLPPKTVSELNVELSKSERDLYESVRGLMQRKVTQAIAAKGLNQSQIIILDALLKLRQVCCHPHLLKLPPEIKYQVPDHSSKLNMLVDIIHQLISEGRSLLVFSTFSSMLHLIEARLQSENINNLKLTGATTNRQKLVDDFQAGAAPVFLISLKAGGTGLNLTRADTVIHFDPWWSPAAENQATDRAHRIGQDKPVFVYKMVAQTTVEEKIQALKVHKQNLADSIYKGDGQHKGLHFSVEDINLLLS